MRANETRLTGQRAGPVITSSGRAPSISAADDANGLDRAIANSASDWWTQGALLAIKQLARSGHGFTVDHVLDMVGAPTDPHYLGAVLASAQRQHIIERVGARVGRDGRLVGVWWGLPAA